MDVMFWIGVLIVILTAVGIVKKFEVRLTLFISGFLMAILGGNPEKVFEEFAGAITSGSLVPIITAAFGFAAVLKMTGCDLHLVNLLLKPMTKMGPLIIPATVAGTAVVTTAISSAAGGAAAIGAVLIPVLIKGGTHPAIAAGAVVAGTSFSMFNPGQALNALLHEISGTSILEIVGRTLLPGIVALAIMAVALMVMDKIGKEKNPAIAKDDGKEELKIGKVNLFMALVPLIPLFLLIFTSEMLGWSPHEFTVLQSMMFGSVVAWLATRKNPQEISKTYFTGMGNGFAKIIGIIAAASAFTAGLEVIGVTDTLIELMEGSTGTVGIAATIGPLFLSALSGSGNAATIAFNNAITPNAADFGLDMVNLGILANLAGSLGRAISPVAGVTIICTTLADVDPMEMVKKNLPGVLIASIVILFMLVGF